MTWLPILPLAGVLLLAPTLAGTDGLRTDEPIRALWLCALVMLTVLATISGLWRGRLSLPATAPARQTIAAFAVFLALALLSVLVRLIGQHSPAYAAPMLRTWAIFATDFGLFVLVFRAAASSRAEAYLLLLAAVLASLLVSVGGVQEYLRALKDGESGHRVFGTSTPDFLAGYLVILWPVTLALFLGAAGRPDRTAMSRSLALLFGLALVLQVATLLMTESRFAVISMAVSLVVFGVTVWRSLRGALATTPGMRRALAGIGILLFLAGAAAGGPLLRRLAHSSEQANSGAFRLYTWKGTLGMIRAFPLFGSGPGTYVYIFPQFALAGFTRLAHETYLQVAAECGVPGLLALLATLGLAGRTLLQGLASGPPPDADPAPSPTPPPAGRTGRRSRPAAPPVSLPAAPSVSWVSALAAADDRLLLCGLIAALAGSAVQNLIDSDWYVFFLGATFWALLGLAAGIASARTASGACPSRPLLAAAGAAAAGVFLFTAASGTGAFYSAVGHAALAVPSPGGQAEEGTAAEQALATAQTWDPLNGRYPSDLGYQVYLVRERNAPQAEQALRTAIALEPTGINWARLATVYDVEGRPADALAAYRSGRRSDPHSLNLLIALAQHSPPDQALAIYREITRLEDSPVGQVRALGDVVEIKYAVADAQVAAAAAAAQDSDSARLYFSRAAQVLEDYADKGGSTNPDRQALLGGRTDPRTDQEMAGLYQKVMAGLIQVSPPDQQAELRKRADLHQAAFQKLFPKA